MEYYKYLETLNKYYGGLPVTVSADWEASIMPLRRCLDDMEALKWTDLDGDEQKILAKLKAHEENGDYLKSLRCLRDIDDVVKGMNHIRHQANEWATGLHQQKKWTWEQLTEWRCMYDRCVILWEQHANELRIELGVQKYVKWSEKVLSLFRDVAACEEFFNCADANTMMCAEWARRAWEFCHQNKLIFSLKGDRKTLYDEIKKAHPQIASLDTFNETFRGIETKLIWNE